MNCVRSPPMAPSLPPCSPFEQAFHNDLPGGTQTACHTSGLNSQPQHLRSGQQGSSSSGSSRCRFQVLSYAHAAVHNFRAATATTVHNCNWRLAAALHNVHLSHPWHAVFAA